MNRDQALDAVRQGRVVLYWGGGASEPTRFVVDGNYGSTNQQHFEVALSEKLISLAWRTSPNASEALVIPGPALD